MGEGEVFVKKKKSFFLLCLEFKKIYLCLI